VPADIPAARLERIQELVRRNTVVSLRQVQQELGVSEMTVRRDFAALDELGIVRRTRGGIVAVERVAPNVPYTERSAHEGQAKQAIGELAASCVEPGDTVFIGAGTTCLAMARALSTREDVTVVTNSVQMLVTLMPNPKLTVISTGGVAGRHDQDLSGPLTRQALAGIRTRKAFIGASGVTPDGLFDASETRAEVNRTMSEHAAATYVLADHTKLGTSALTLVVPIGDVDTLVTDRPLARADRNWLADAGAVTVLAPDKRKSRSR
jgi:DeoR/GlpR family transcriptional regulator of sugar metabolism